MRRRNSRIFPIEAVRDEEDNWLKITFALPGRTMYAKIWKAEVGRTPLYLLDTDIEENVETDRVITHQLYGGDSENRLRQEDPARYRRNPAPEYFRDTSRYLSQQ